MGVWDNISTCRASDGQTVQLNQVTPDLDTTLYRGIFTAMELDVAEPYTDAGPYAKTTRRFMTLKDSEIPNAPTGKTFFEPVSASSETRYVQIAVSETELTTGKLEEYEEHEIEIKPDSTIIWKAYGLTHTIKDFANGTGLDIGDGYSYVSFKFQQDDATIDSGAHRSRVKKLLITLKDQSP